MYQSKVSKYLLWWAGIALALSLIFGAIGFYKIAVYENSEYSWQDTKNAYVGGDAYNYIINGTYFAGYCALSGALLICSTISAAFSFKIQLDSEKSQQQFTSNETVEGGIDDGCTES